MIAKLMIAAQACAALLLIALAFPSPSKAEALRRVIHGEATMLHLPRGMCDATGTLFGDHFINVVTDLAKMAEVRPIPLFSFMDCASIASTKRVDQPVVWGYFGYLRVGQADPKSFNQHSLNGILESKFGDTLHNETYKAVKVSSDAYMKDKDRTFTFGQIVRIQPNVADQFAHIARYYIDTKADGEDITLLVG